METFQPPFSNIQLELLRLYKANVDETDLFAIKKLISEYFAAKAIKNADEVWEKQNWNEDKIQELLNTKMRAPYQKHSL